MANNVCYPYMDYSKAEIYLDKCKQGNIEDCWEFIWQYPKENPLLGPVLNGLAAGIFFAPIGGMFGLGNDIGVLKSMWNFGKSCAILFTSFFAAMGFSSQFFCVTGTALREYLNSNKKVVHNNDAIRENLSSNKIQTSTDIFHENFLSAYNNNDNYLVDKQDKQENTEYDTLEDLEIEEEIEGYFLTENL